MRMRRALVLGFIVFLSIVKLSQGKQEPFLPTPRLAQAYIALQAWKHSITSDPNNLTSDWYGYNVCNYTGVYCTAALDDPHLLVVAGIDLNRGNIEGTLPYELGLLADLALLHLNSNRFHGTVPATFDRLKLLYELDLSNNRFSGHFPAVLLHLPSLKYIDLRFNRFKGAVPSALFKLNLDAVFVNNNNFQFSFPDSLGSSPASVLVLANIRLNGCLPRTIAQMAGTLNELMLANSSLNGCIPPEIGKLKNLTVFDVSSNNLVGPLPEEIGEMERLEQLNVAHNQLSGAIPDSICALPNLKNFTFSYNYLCTEPDLCLKLKDRDDSENCIPYRPKQRSEEECAAFLAHPAHCESFTCTASPPPPPPPSPPPPPPPHY